ncbi:hypothetical protein [Rhizobium tumorigenes]|uniref:hypothetical protein n=1 Tax=Rhizobium tumorigenes TaxID=2041385 RepID=UPI00241CC627|nr:hypothetical protein [Rhizobium tumorigenes]WFS03219.1 hypothetical protein PR016_21430 [Rhizobium tumorigenes]
MKQIISFIVATVVMSLSATFSFAIDRGLSMEVIRAPPERERLLKLIDDDFARGVFASLEFVGAEEQGELDGAIESKWCELTPAILQSLFDSKFVQKSDVDDFVQMPEPIAEKFDVYGVRSIGYRQFGVGANNTEKCLTLYIIDTN